MRSQLGLHLVLIELSLILFTVFGSNVFTQDEAKMKAAIAHRPKKLPPPNPELELGDGKFKWLTLPDPMNIDIYAVPEQAYGTVTFKAGAHVREVCFELHLGTAHDGLWIVKEQCATPAEWFSLKLDRELMGFGRRATAQPGAKHP